MKPDTRISVLLVDDSALVLAVLMRILAGSSDLHVVGTARNGREALALIAKLKPRIVCTDLHMPEMDGLELTRQIMVHHPCPILVISDYVHKEDQANVFSLLEAGALDVYPKPRGGQGADYDRLARDLISKIKILSGVVVFRKHAASPAGAARAKSVKSAPRSGKTYQILAMGASTGGPNAFQALLSALPDDFPMPIVCVQHISEGFLPGMVEWLGQSCKKEVRIAEPGESPARGTVYFAREGAHLEFDKNGRFSQSQAEPFEGHRPSVNALFHSVARQFGSAAVAVLLTGMGRDGAAGMQAIAKAGGLTIAQSEESCLVFGMPKEAIELKATSCVLPLPEIAPTLGSLYKA